MVILLYHDIVRKDAPKGLYAVGEEDFACQFAWLLDHGYRILALNDLAGILRSSGGLPERAVAITFDDGLKGQYEFAYPLFARARVPGSFFIIASAVGREGYVDWRMAGDLLENGMEVGSHGWGHLIYDQLSKARILEEMKKSRETLEQNLHAKVPLFSIPRGSLLGEREFSALAREAGYGVLCSSRVGYITGSESPLFLPRFPMRRTDTLKDFIRIVKNDAMTLLCAKTKYACKDMLKRVMGIAHYERMRHSVLRGEYATERPSPERQSRSSS